MKRNYKLQFVKSFLSTAFLLVSTIFTNVFAQLPVTIGTTAAFTNINGNGMITFNFQNTNPYGVILTDIEGVTGAAGSQVCEVWYNPTPMTGVPVAVTAANGWTLAMSGTYAGVTNTTTTVTQSFITGGTFVIPANTTYALCISSANQRYYSIPAGTPATAFGAGGGCNMIFSSAYSYGGGVPPAAPTNASRGWIGKITFKAATIYPNNASISALTAPVNFCAGNQDINVRLRNGGNTVINTVTVKWTRNGVPQTPISWAFPLDSIGGTGIKDTVITLQNFAFAANTSYVIRAWTESPEGMPDGFPADDTLTVTLKASLNGSFTVGGVGANYPTLVALVDDLNTIGICGPVDVLVNPGTYAGKVAIRNIAGSSSVNTITIRGTNKNTCILTDSVADATLSVTNTSFVTIRDLTVNNRFYTTCAGISIVGANGAKGSNTTVNNCIVNIPNTGTNTSYGLMASGAANTISATPIDSVVFDSNVVNGGYYGIVIYGSSNTANNRGNMIRYNTLNNTWVYGVYFYYNYNPVKTVYNTINMNPSNTSTAYGLSVGYNQNPSTTESSLTIGNKIYNASYMGMQITYNSTTATAPHKVYNNVIAGAMKYSTNYAFYLYSTVGSASLYEVYHNTIQVSGFGATQYGLYYYNSLNVSGIRAKNNTFGFISMAGTGATNAYPAYFASNPSGNVVNYNTYYNSVGPNLVWRVSAATAATYKTATFGGDSSYNKNPYTSGTLNLNDGCVIGVDLTASVATDINNTPRIVTPTAGAFEYVRSANDMVVESIITPLNATTPGSQDVIIRVRNTGNIQATSFNVNYKLNSGAVVTEPWTGTLNPCDTVSITFSTQITFIMGQNDLKVYTSDPNIGVDANGVNDTIKVTYYNYLPLNGSYTIGGVGYDFATPAEAALMLTRAGISGPVDFTIRPGTYSGAVVLANIAGVSATNTITFDGVNAATCIITTSTADVSFMVNQISYVTLKNITINNLSTLPTSGIALIGNVINTSGKGFTVNKCVVNIPNSGTSVSHGILVTGNAFGLAEANQWVDSVTIDSCTITGGYNGIVISTAANSNATYNRGHKVRYNTVNNSYSYGIKLYYLYNQMDVLYNTVTMIPSANLTYGIYFYYCQNSSTIPSRVIGNKVMNAGYMGLTVANSNNGTSSTTQIYNNIVGGVFGYSTNYGLYAPTTQKVEMLHNTVNIGVGSAGTTKYGMYYSGAAAGSTFKNNVFSITAMTGTTVYPAYFGTNPTGNVANYNNYYNAAGAIVVYRGSGFTAANYKTATAGGDSSFSQSPLYVSETNFHNYNACAKGVDLTAIVPVDYDGTIRPVAPSLGAYEAVGLANDIAVDKVYTLGPIKEGLQDISVRVKNNTPNIVSSMNVKYILNGGAVVTMPWSGTLLGCGDTAYVTFTGAEQANILSGTNSLRIFTDAPNATIDNNRTNDSVMLVLSTLTKVNGNALNGNGTGGAGVGSAIRFDSKPEMIGTTAVTAMAWVKLTVNNIDQKVICKSNVSNGISLGVSTTGALDPEVWTVAGGTTSVRMTGASGVSLPTNIVPVNQWTHIAFTWQSGVGVKAYINGSMIGYLNSTTATTITPSTNDLFIGSNAWDFGHPANGRIDEVSLWNVALDSLEIRRQMHRTLAGTETGLVSYIQLNEPVNSANFSDVISGSTGYRGTATAIVASTAPLGGDSTLTLAGTYGGIFSNGTATINLYDGFDNACDLTITQIPYAPNVLPTATHTFNNKYWVVQPFGTPGVFAADVTLAFPVGQLNTSDASLGLYRRSYNSDGAWVLYRTSTSVTPFDVTFNVIDTFGQFTIASNGTSTLPVSLLSFGAKANNNMVNVNWTTATEVNSKYFDIERTYDLSADFQQVGTVKAGGNSTSKINYMYQDKSVNLSKTVYYRLKQVDVDGKYSYSPVAVVEPTLDGTGKVEVYPNPFNSGVEVSFVAAKTGEKATIQVVNIAGKTVHTELVNTVSGRNNTNINLGDLQSGVYFISIEVNGTTTNLKLVKN